MAITITSPDGSPVASAVPGTSRRSRLTVTFDASYPTGGYVLTPTLVGLTTIESVLTDGTTITGGKPVATVQSGGAWKLKVFSAIGTEVANAASLAGDSVQCEAVGK